MIKRSVLNYLLVVIVGLSASLQALANYQAGDQYFARRDYVNAASQFFNAYVAAPNLSQKRKAEWRLALSLEKLGLFYSASKYYSVIVRRGRRADNPLFRDALEKLGRINYRISLGQAHVTKLFKAKSHHLMFLLLLEAFTSTTKELKSLIKIDLKSRLISSKKFHQEVLTTCKQFST